MMGERVRGDTLFTDTGGTDAVIAGNRVGSAPARANLHRMTSALRKPMTLPQFLAWEERQEQRFEFDGARPVAMTGGTDAHEAIGGALRAILHAKLHGGLCRARGPTMKIETAGRIRYPDAFVYCSTVERHETVIRDPVVVFEVLSAGTSRIDRIEKLREYQATPSIRRYVILEQESVAATMFFRRGDDWIARVLTDAATIEMPEIGINVSLAEIYAEIGAGLKEEPAAAFEPG